MIYHKPSFEETFFNDHLIHVSKIENIDFELVRKTVLKSSFIVLRGLVPPKNVKISKLLLSKWFNQENDHYGIVKPEVVKKNNSKLMIGGHIYNQKFYNPRFMRIIYNPFFDKDIFKCHDIFRIASVVRNNLLKKSKNFAIDNISDIWTACRFHQYPSGGGFLHPHKDKLVPKIIKKFGKLQYYQVFINMSSIPNDYKAGGAFIVYNGKVLKYDKFCQLGDIIIYNGETTHGVLDIDPGEKIDLDSINGRLAGFVTLYLDNYSKYLD